MGSTEGIHLVVFVHGLWGNPSHLQYLVDQFGEKYNSHNIHILNAKSNTSAYTYDGVDVCGDRLVDEIKAEIKSIQKKVTKFSIIGYSLGGLVSRYVIGILYQQKFFESIEPMLFTTFATPHLGIRREDDKTYTKIVNWFSSTLLSKTGEQLTFMDKYNEVEPILLTLSRPDKIFFKALSDFRYKKLYANARNDRTVPFWTAAISEIDPFENINEIAIEPSKKCKDIIKSVSKVENVKKSTFIQIIKKVPRYILVTVVVIILFPFWVVLVLSTVTVQGILSKRRVQRILATKDKSNSDDHSLSRINAGAASIEDDAVETAMNIKNIFMPSISTTSNLNPSDDDTQSFDFTTSSLFPRVQLSQPQYDAFINLNKLKWEKFVVLLDAYNAHASIVNRNRLMTLAKKLDHYQKIRSQTVSSTVDV